MAVWMEMVQKYSCESSQCRRMKVKIIVKVMQFDFAIANYDNDARLSLGIHLKIKAPSRTDIAALFLKLVC